jgi:NAD(P)-dependent dehydrogenase (short-subunit alcohol dehydrogenase family)
MGNPSKVALVTGASRGIGRGCALALAKAGFDVVLCARTVVEGTPLEHSSTVQKSDTSPLPGSLETTAGEVEALGQRALVAKLDLLVESDLERAVKDAVGEFGRLDVVVNNARYIGPGHMDLFLDTPMQVYEDHFVCNVLAPLRLVKLAVPHMRAQGGGVIVHITSGAGNDETPALPGEGGWGLGYSISKAAFNRIAAGLGKELKQHGIAVINLEPGYVGTERMAQDLKEFGFDGSDALPVDVPGSVCAYLASHPKPMAFSGRNIDAPSFAVDVGLVDGDSLPEPYGSSHWGLPSRGSLGS